MTDLAVMAGDREWASCSNREEWGGGMGGGGCCQVEEMIAKHYCAV